MLAWKRFLGKDPYGRWPQKGLHRYGGGGGGWSKLKNLWPLAVHLEERLTVNQSVS